MYYKFIMWIGRQALCLKQIVLLLLVATQIYKHGGYEPHCLFHGAQYPPDLLHECSQLPLEFIAWKTLFQDFS